MRVIGTAGHVDHGKSTLVRALTGIDPDRLKEEKKRQMTIDLGFAWYESPVVGPIGIVDVPGHRDFIENMLAGMGGLDAVLLVIAADEGIMPQTREHLAIIDLLHITSGLIVLTKTDLVNDPGWIDLVELDVQEALSGSALEDAPIIRFSAVTGEGLDELKRSIDQLLLKLEPKVDAGRPRLPVDRVFSMTGFGTVVTGTLIGGSFKVDEQVQILPAMSTGKIRGIQSHKQPEFEALPGSRSALNISGIDVTQVKRGNTVTRPGMFTPTRRIDAWVELLRTASVGLKHNDKVKVFIGTAESLARIRLLQKQILAPGEAGWVQLETTDEIIADQDDRFILRRLSPAETIGGGLVVDPHPANRYKLNDPRVIERLETRITKSSLDVLYGLILDHPFINLDEMNTFFIDQPGLISEGINSMTMTGKIIRLSGRGDKPAVFLEARYWEKLTVKLQENLARFHQQKPLLPGMNSAELAGRMRVTEKNLDYCLSQWTQENLIKDELGMVALSTFEIKYSSNQTQKIKQFYSIIDQAPFNPPGIKEVREILGDSLFESLIKKGELVQLSPDVLIRQAEYNSMLEYVRSVCREGNLLTLAQFRDHFSTSRKYSQAFLEHLDRIGITVRVGEGRSLRK